MGAARAGIAVRIYNLSSVGGDTWTYGGLFRGWREWLQSDTRDGGGDDGGGGDGGGGGGGDDGGGGGGGAISSREGFEHGWLWTALVADARDLGDISGTSRADEIGFMPEADGDDGVVLRAPSRCASRVGSRVWYLGGIWAASLLGGISAAGLCWDLGRSRLECRWNPPLYVGVVGASRVLRLVEREQALMK